jgi:hypothetical protein
VPEERRYKFKKNLSSEKIRRFNLAEERRQVREEFGGREKTQVLEEFDGQKETQVQEEFGGRTVRIMSFSSSLQATKCFDGRER